MFLLISMGILLAALLAIGLVRLTGRPAALSWVAAALGALLAWVSLPLWQFELPARLPLNTWSPLTLFHAAPDFQADAYAWLYAFSLSALAAAVIFTSPARLNALSPLSWFGTIALSLLALLAVMANNILTLALTWTALDLLEYLNTLRMARTPAVAERAVVALTFRAAGTGFALWAAVVSAAAGSSVSLQETPPEAWLFLLLAVGLRLGVIPLHLPFREDVALRRGIGSALRLTAAATSLVVLARLPDGAIESPLLPALLLLVALAALYAGWKWLSLPDELNARPYWIIGMSALSLAAALRGSQQGSAAWGTALVLFGGLSFLYSARQVWFSRLLAGLVVFLLSLPFTLTATGWEGNFPLPALFWPLFLTAHAMLTAGYLRHVFRSGETPFGELPRWAQSAYPLGLGVLALTLLLTGLWGWPGGLQIGVWQVALLLTVLALLMGAAFWRVRQSGVRPESSPSHSEPGPSRFDQIQEFLAGLLWSLYRLTGRMVGYVTALLEGDGGLLWTMLLLLVVLTALRGS